MTSFPALPPNYSRALELIDAAHAEDPNKVVGSDGESTTPYELHYAQKMTRYLLLRSPRASPELQLACRAQHFRRWEIARSSYPMTRAGYLTWRARLKSQAAAQVAELLSSADSGIDPPLDAASVARVAALVRKDGLAKAVAAAGAEAAAGGSGVEPAEEDDLEAQVRVLEDVACLVFLDDQLDGFEKREDVDEPKMVDILRKTWAKMSAPGRELALGMQLSDRGKELVGKALGGGES